MDGRYLAGLEGSWHGLAAARPSARVVTAPGLLALQHPDPVLCNAALLRPDALPAALEVFAGSAAFAVWTATDEVAAAAAAAGLRRDVTTRPMVRPAGPTPPVLVPVEVDADPVLVCRLNGVADDLLTGVPDLRCVVSADGAACAAVQDVGDDVVLSFVTTRPQARGRGLATAVTAAALRDAAERGRSGAVLQATPAAEGLYARLGFRAVGRWQEWVPAGGSAAG